MFTTILAAGIGAIPVTVVRGEDAAGAESYAVFVNGVPVFGTGDYFAALRVGYRLSEIDA